jgi:hypothetical protein
MSADPTRKILSAINVKPWLAELPASDRKLIEMRVAGHQLGELAAEVGGSTSGVCRRLKHLGRSLARHAGIDVEGVTELAESEDARRATGCATCRSA